MYTISPLRYPGGKQILANLLAYLIRSNGAQEGVYIEPFAGGAGAALSLPFGEHVRRIMINDADLAIAAFWRAVLHQTSGFLKLLKTTPLSIDEWRRQRSIYLHPRRHSSLRVGFATFYLNRCNRSGIIASGGVIGGNSQSGRWKIDARFNREQLAERVEKIALYRDRIELFNLDAIAFLKQHMPKRRSEKSVFVYLDPPYYAKGKNLYLNYYDPGDHATLAAYLIRKAPFQWVMSYDNVPEIRRLYQPLRTIKFDLAYTARDRRVGKELLILKDTVSWPANWKAKIPNNAIGMNTQII